MDNFTKKLIDKVYTAHQHSIKTYLATEDKEYLGQAIALEAVLVSLQPETDEPFARLDHLCTFVKKEHRP